MRLRPEGARYFSLFGVLGAGCLLAGVLNGRASWLFFGWCAIAFLGVSLAYGFLGPRALGKRPDGSLAPVSLLVFLPYFALTRGLRGLKTVLDRSPHSHEILPDLWLGAWPESVRRLPEDCALVVDLTAEFAVARSVKQGAGSVLCLPILDTDAPTQEQLREGIDAIESAAGPVYVHCAAGVGRSATLVGAYLLAHGLAESVDTAEAFLQNIRYGVRFTPPQRRLLQRGDLPKIYETASLCNSYDSQAPSLCEDSSKVSFIKN